MKRGYIVDEEGSEYGVGVIAHNSKEAKAWAKSDDMFADSEYINIRATWKKECKVDDMPYGVVDDLRKGLSIGLYGWIEEEECEICKCESRLWLVNEKLMCTDCEEKFQEDAKSVTEDSE